MIELYFFHGATCGLKARIAFAEKGVAYEGHAVNRPYLRTPDYLKLNPNGVVPTIIHDGEVLRESSVIINYLDDAFEGPALKPDDALGAARTWWWMKRADECLTMIGILTYTVSLRPGIIATKTPEELEEYIEGTPNPAAKESRRKMIEMGFDNPAFPIALKGLDMMLADMEDALNKHEWLAANSYGLADISLTSLIERMSELQCHEMWENDRPKVTAWWEKIKARPSYEACLGPTPNPEKPIHQAAGRKSWPEIKRLLAA